MRAQAIPHNIPHDFVIAQTRRILSSYKKWTGKDLLQNQSHIPEVGLVAGQTLFYAPFVVVSSNNAADPMLTYGNQKCLELWEMPWEILTKTPGRLTAEPVHQNERQKFLDTVKKNGFIDNYSGIRISASGKRFKIENAVVWNLVDESEKFIGQAAAFSDWKYV